MPAIAPLSRLPARRAKGADHVVPGDRLRRAMLHDGCADKLAGSLAARRARCDVSADGEWPKARDGEPPSLSPDRHHLAPPTTWQRAAVGADRPPIRSGFAAREVGSSLHQLCNPRPAQSLVQLGHTQVRVSTAADVDPGHQRESYGVNSEALRPTRAPSRRMTRCPLPTPRVRSTPATPMKWPC